MRNIYLFIYYKLNKHIHKNTIKVGNNTYKRFFCQTKKKLLLRVRFTCGNRMYEKNIYLRSTITLFALAYSVL